MARGQKRGAAKAHAKAAASKKPKTHEDIARKAVRDNLVSRGVQNDARYVMQGDGLSLWQRVLADVALRGTRDAKVMGARYWRELRAKYLSEDDPRSKLKAPQPPLSIAPRLLTAAVAAKRARPDHGPLSAFLDAAGKLNATERHGVWMWCLGLRLSADKHLGLCMIAIRWVARSDVRKEAPSEFAAVRQWIDRVLVKLFARSKRDKMSPASWARLHADELKLLVPAEPFQATLDADPNFDTCLDSLHEVVASSEIGHSLFSFALSKHLCSSVEATISEHVEKMLKLPVLDFNALHASKLAALEACEALPNMALLPERRQISVPFGKAVLHGSVSSVTMEVGVRFGAAWKALGRQQGKVNSLWCEDVLQAGVSTQAFAKKTISDALVNRCNTARAECAAAFERNDSSNRAEVLKVLKSKRAHWLLLDADFHVEIWMMESLCGECSELRLATELLQQMPTPTRAKDPDVVLQLVHGLSETPSYKLASVSAQAKQGLVEDALSALVDARSPKLAILAQDPVLLPIVTAFGNFIRYDQAKPKKVFVGQEAYGAWLDQFLRDDDAKALEPSAITMLTTFDFFRPVDRAEEALAFIEKANKRSGKGRSAGSARAQKPGKKIAVQDKGAVAEAMAMFTG